MTLAGLKYYLSNPLRIWDFLADRNLLNWMSDEKFLKINFYLRMGSQLDLNNPQTFNEKLQWLKLHNRKPEYTTMVDKYAVKQYVADKIGAEHIIPTLGVWNHFDEIDFDTLPNQFVLKCNHDCGSIVICTDKSKLDKKKAKQKLERAFGKNYFWKGREWPYKDVKPRIFAEQYMVDDSGSELKDYKLMCFSGKVKCSFTVSERFLGGLKVTFYDNNWDRMPFERHYPAADKDIPKPTQFERMIAAAEILSTNIPFVRVDFYEVKGKMYFGEMTFFPGGGLEEFTPVEWDYTLGSWLDLSKL